MLASDTNQVVINYQVSTSFFACDQEERGALALNIPLHRAHLEFFSLLLISLSDKALPRPACYAAWNLVHISVASF